MEKGKFNKHDSFHITLGLRRFHWPIVYLYNTPPQFKRSALPRRAKWLKTCEHTTRIFVIVFSHHWQNFHLSNPSLLGDNYYILETGSIKQFYWLFYGQKSQYESYLTSDMKRRFKQLDLLLELANTYSTQQTYNLLTLLLILYEPIDLNHGILTNRVPLRFSPFNRLYFVKYQCSILTWFVVFMYRTRNG